MLCRFVSVRARAAAAWLCEAGGRDSRGSQERGSPRNLSSHAAARRYGNASTGPNARCLAIPVKLLWQQARLEGHSSRAIQKCRVSG